MIHLEPGDLEQHGQPNLLLFDGASSGLLGQSDIESTAAIMEPGSDAGLLLYENKWAAPLAAALRREGAALVAHGYVPIEEVALALEAAATPA